MKADPRLQAARAVAAVLGHGRSLADVLPDLTQSLTGADRGLAAELAYGTLRFAPRYTWLAGRLLKRPLDRREPLVHALLLVGFHQLEALRVPPHAAIHATVNAVKLAGRDWAAGLLNAVLRRFQREAADWAERIASHEAARLAHPAWLIRQLRKDWPDHADAMLAANNDRAPMTLRVNRRHGSVAAYRQRLDEAGLGAQPHPHAPEALVLDEALDVAALPGFAAGDVSVQDAAAQLAAELLAVRPGERVLDACAAPGGKTAHLLETAEPGELVAVDRDEARLDRVAENLARLQLGCALVHGDAGRPADWWDGEAFDAILLDAPCTATGVIRRHPDIKSLRRPGDVDALVSQQARLLDALWELLRPGGRLLYATCSVLAAENARQIKSFLGRRSDATAMPVAADWGFPAGTGRQILPGEAGMDGFFYAKILKTGGQL